MRERKEVIVDALREARRIARESGEHDEDTIQLVARDLADSYMAVQWLNNQPPDKSQALIDKAMRLAESRGKFFCQYGGMNIYTGARGRVPMLPDLSEQLMKTFFYTIALVEIIFETRIDEGWVP